MKIFYVDGVQLFFPMSHTILICAFDNEKYKTIVKNKVILFLLFVLFNLN